MSIKRLSIKGVIENFIWSPIGLNDGSIPMDHLTNEIAAIKNHWPFYRFKNDHCSGLEKTQDRKRKHPLPQMEYQSLHPLFTANCHLFGRYHWVIYWNLSFYHRLKSDCRGCVFLEDVRKIALFHLQVNCFYRFRHFQFWMWPLQHNFRCRNESISKSFENYLWFSF